MNTISELIEDIRAGQMVILVDDENRENEGDLILAADFVTPQAINFMAREARGLICLAMTAEQIEKLGLPPMVRDEVNLSPNRTAFTVSIEAAHGVSTGISAADRCHTIRVAANPAAKPSDVIMPGHVFPIKAQKGGVLKRAGHTEASVDLASLAGLNPAAVICEIMNEDGTMARTSELREFAIRNNIKIGTIEDLISYRIENESFVEKRVSAMLANQFGSDFRVHLFKNTLDGREHLAIVKGDVNTDEPVLVRVHSENILGDVLGHELVKSGIYLRQSLELISRAGRGVVVYLRQEDMGNILESRISAMNSLDLGQLQPDEFREAFYSDQRDYGVGAQILRALGIKKIKLISNHPAKKVGLKGYGLEIVDNIALEKDDREFSVEI